MRARVPTEVVTQSILFRRRVEKVNDVLEGGDNGPIMTRDNNTGPVSRAPRGAGADGLGAE